MSLGIAFKGPEGIVLAADSRVTLTAQMPGQNMLLPATYDNATKLLKITGQDYMGVVTYGLGALGQQNPRTAHSFVPEFEAELAEADTGRLSADAFAERLSAFFMKQWAESMPADYQGPDMFFLVAGFDEGAAYGRVLEIAVPSKPTPHEHNSDPGEFGMVYGGQREFVNRLLSGFDDNLVAATKQHLSMTDDEATQLREHLRQNCSIPIPFPFLPLQDCVDLAIFCIRATVAMQSWYIGIRGVGGAVDVATITRTAGFVAVQQKAISGERAAG